MKAIIDYIWDCKELWRSLSIIAEIEPDLLMQEYENDYNKNDNSDLSTLFLKGNYSSDYADFLHSFVRIADSQNSAVKICKMLFELCKLDIEYIYNGDTPLTTLLSILWLHIHNNALSLEKKKKLILSFFNNNKDLSLKIAIESIKKDSDICQFRIGSAIKADYWFSEPEYAAAIKEIFSKVTEVIINEPNTELVSELIHNCFFIPFEQFKEFLQRISGLRLNNDQLIKICYLLREKVFWNEMSDNKSSGKYMDMFKKYVNILEDKLPIKRLFAFHGDPYNFPYYEDIVDEDRSKVDDDKQILEYRISWLNEIDIDDIRIVINAMDNFYYWGILLSESKFKTNAFHVVNIALEFRKFAIIAGVIDGIELNQATDILSKIGNEEVQNILPFLDRDDILSYFKSDSSLKSYWSNKIMREYKAEQYECLLNYNPTGLLLYYAYREPDISAHSNEVIEIIDAINKTGTNISNHQRYIDKLINRLDNTGYYSDEYALKCLKLFEISSIKIEMYECIKRYYFIHYDNLVELLNDDIIFFDFINRYSIPKVYEKDLGKR